LRYIFEFLKLSNKDGDYLKDWKFEGKNEKNDFAGRDKKMKR
jgi:hypothetical protein